MAIEYDINEGNRDTARKLATNEVIVRCWQEEKKNEN